MTSGLYIHMHVYQQSEIRHMFTCTHMRARAHGHQVLLSGGSEPGWNQEMGFECPVPMFGFSAVGTSTNSADGLFP